MKIHVRPNDDGTVDLYVERTLPNEGRSRTLRKIGVDLYRDVLAKVIAEMRGEPAPESPVRP